MSNVSGFGTLYYGWKHSADGTGTATKWITILWLPVIPLFREKLRVLTNFKEDSKNIRAELGGLVLSQQDKYERIGRLPLSINEILVTYLKAYIGLPIILIGPLVLLFAFLGLLHHFGVSIEPNSTPFYIFMVGYFIAFINFLWQCVRAIRRARGWQPNI